MALQGRQSLIGVEVNSPLLGRIKGPAKEWFARKTRKRYNSVLCLGFHIPLEDVFRSRKGQ
jgi:hypothetical protein